MMDFVIIKHHLMPLDDEPNEKTPDIIKKIIIYGPCESGKTLLFRQLTKQKVSDNLDQSLYRKTVYCNYSSKLYKAHDIDLIYKFQVFDFSGDFMYLFLLKSFIKDGDIIILVYDDAHYIQIMDYYEKIFELNNKRIIFVNNN